MDGYLRNFMSREEKEQMDALIERAIRRKARREEAASGAKWDQFCKCQCQCECMEEMGRVEEKKGQGKNRSEEMERLLQAICDFCLKYDLCQCPYHQADRQMQKWAEEMEVEERRRNEEMSTGELPFR